MNYSASILNIKHFAVHDGDGIRTTVFFKGCPLACKWCHNPEGISFKAELAYHSEKCTLCQKCASVCPASAHIFQRKENLETVHALDRQKCLLCGKCEKECLSDALFLYGKKVSVADILPELLEDRLFFDTSGGGVTLSGGECLSQFKFAAELLSALKKENINCAVDTSGYASKEAIDAVMPYTDTFLYDVKAFREDTHIAGTGRSNKIILENLCYIDSCGKDIEIRIPLIPNYNDGEIDMIGEFLSHLSHIKAVRILPYHSYCASKYESVDRDITLPDTMPSAEEVEKAEKTIEKYGIKIIKNS